jgi:hypothetical protein
VSQIIDATNRISTIVKLKNIANIPGVIISQHEPYPPCKSVIPAELNQAQSNLIDECLGGYQPRLTLNQIEEVIESYRFNLPQEFYDLYQLGNGCLPLGTSEDEDWDSIYNYFYFPSSEAPFWTLRNAMSSYVNHLIDCNPHLLPICAYGDDSVLLVLGSTERQENSPLLMTYDHCLDSDLLQMEIVWLSLTNMMLAYAERYEALYQGRLTETEKTNIYQKYSSGSDLGFYKFLR